MGRGRTETFRIALLTSVVALGATGVFAQDSAFSGSFSLSTTLSAETNPDLIPVSTGTVVELSENLMFSLSTETSIQLLELLGEIELSYSQIEGGGSDTDFTIPDLTLHYFRDTGNANFDASTSFRSGDVSDSFGFDPSDPAFLVVDDGTLDVTEAAVAFNWGVNAPLGFSLSATHEDLDYEGTTDLSLFDSTTDGLSASANLRISPVTQGLFTISRTDEANSDAASTNIETTLYGFDLSHELGRALTIDGSLGYVSESTTAGGTTTLISGLTAGLDMTQALPSGTVFGGLQFDDSGILSSTALTIGRSIDLPAATVSANLTADWTEGSDAELLGSVAYTQELRNGSVSVEFDQTLDTDGLDRDIKFSTLGIDFDTAVSPRSDISLSLDIGRSVDSGSSGADTLSRADLTATYSRELTPSWGLSVGYSHLRSSGSVIATATSDQVFLSLTKGIEFGF